MSDSFATPWTVDGQTTLSVGLPKQEYWSRLPFPLSGDLSNPGIKLASPALQADSLLLSHQGSPFHNILIMQNKLHGLFVCTYNLYCRRKWQPTPVLLPGKSNGWKSLVGYSPWGHKESDTTERLHSLHFTIFIPYLSPLWI